MARAFTHLSKCICLNPRAESPNPRVQGTSICTWCASSVRWLGAIRRRGFLSRRAGAHQ